MKHEIGGILKICHMKKAPLGASVATGSVRVVRKELNVECTLALCGFSTLPLLIIFFYFILCVWIFCLHVCLCIMCVPGACRGQKRASDPVELELQIVVRCHVDADT